MAEPTASSASQEMPQSDTAKDEKSRAKAEPGLFFMLLKDAAIILAALSIWAAADTWHQVTGLWLAEALSVADAILVGLLLASLFHEWGHYSGAMVSGAKAPRVALPGLTLFRFNFDFSANNLRQFHWMSLGGHVLPWAILIVLAITLPFDSLGRIALVSAIFGFLVFATVIEYGIVKQTRAGADPKETLEKLSSKDFQQASVIGTLGGLFAIAALS